MKNIIHILQLKENNLVILRTLTEFSQTADCSGFQDLVDDAISVTTSIDKAFGDKISTITEHLLMLFENLYNNMWKIERYLDVGNPSHKPWMDTISEITSKVKELLINVR